MSSKFNEHATTKFFPKMRLSTTQVEVIRQLSRQVGREGFRVRVFASRVDDAAHGGDLDLLLELPDPVGNPALVAA